MARTGTQFAKITSSYSALNAYATWQLKSTDVETKKFVIRLRAYITVTSSATYTSTTSTFKLNDKTIKSGDYSYTKGDNLIGYRDIEVSANEDGTFPDTEISFYAKSYHFTATIKKATLTSDDIPKMDIGSSITDIKEIVGFTAPGVTLGIELSSELLSGYTTNLTSKLDGISYSLYQGLNNENVRLYFDEGTYNFYYDSDIADGYLSILYPLTWQEICSLIPNEKSINIPLTLETYDNLTLLAAITKNYTFTVTKAFIEYEPYLKSDDKTVEFTGSDKVFIENFSSLTVVPNVLDEGNGATVKKYKYTETQYGTSSLSEMISSNFIVATSTTTSEQPTLTYNKIATVEDNVFMVTYGISLIDSRGLETDTVNVRLAPSENYSVLKYFLPTIENATVVRPENTATYVKIDLNGSFWNDTFGTKENILKLEYRFKLSNENDFREWQELTPTIEENKFSYSGNIENISEKLSAVFEIRVTDTLGNSDIIKDLQVSKGKSMFDWAENYFSWNGELCINDEEIPCFTEESTESDGSRNVQLYDSENNKIFPNVRSGAGGTSNYNSLSNLPSINGITLKGSLNTSDLGISYEDLEDKPTIPTVPTNVSAFTNDAGYLTSVPNEYALKTDIPDVSDFATEEDLEYVKSDVSTLFSSQSVMNKVINENYQNIQTLNSTITNKVDKVDGKDLSTNDYTTAEKTKLAGIETGAGTNIIEEIKVNNTTQTVTNKSVNITVPTNNNQLSNGAGYQTASEVNTLIASAIGDIQGISYEVVLSLPSTGEAGVIYLISNGGSGSNIYDEYIYINGTYEKIGTTDIDLSGYAKTSDIPTDVSSFNNDVGYLTEHQDIKTINNNSLIGSGNLDINEINTISGDTRIWELDEGIYTLTDETSHKIYYKGATDTNYLSINNVGMIFITQTTPISTTYKNFIIFQPFDGYNSIVYGWTTSTTGSYGSKSLNVLEETTNKVNTLSSSSTNTQYPSALAVYNALSNKADTEDIPTKTSELTNDSGYLTSIPSEYVTETELNSKGYLTTYTETDPIFSSSVASSITSDNIEEWTNKQDKLISGSNIKTINGSSILGSGNLTIESGSGSEIEELTSPVRLWDLEDGIYKLPADCVVYYKGATSTDSFALNSASYLFISAYSTDRKNFNILLGGTLRYSSIRTGYVSSTSGAYYEQNLGDIKPNTVGSYNLGTYLYTKNISDINSTSYLYVGEYLFGITSSTTGIPSGITEDTRVCLKTYSNNISGLSYNYTHLRQDLYAPTLNKHWYRIVDYTDSSNVSYGDWIEIIEDLDTSDFALKTDIPDTSSFVQDSSYVHTDNNFTSTYKANVDSNTSARHTHSNKTVLDGITSAKITSWDNKSDFSGNYNDLTNKPTIPTIPTNISAFTNDVGYLTEHQDISSKQDVLVSGTNIKTINGASLLGEGNLVIEGGSGTTFEYEIGDVFITSTNSDPSTRLGGTWELIDKQFASKYASDDDTWFTPTSGNNTRSSNAYTRDGHSVRIKVVTTTAKTFTDTDVDLGTLDLEKLGMTSILGTLNVICYINDDALGIVAINYSTGALTWRGLIGEATSVASGSSITIDTILETKFDYMQDEVCDKFYWKKTA